MIIVTAGICISVDDVKKIWLQMCFLLCVPEIVIFRVHDVNILLNHALLLEYIKRPVNK